MKRMKYISFFIVLMIILCCITYPVQAISDFIWSASSQETSSQSGQNETTNTSTKENSIVQQNVLETVTTAEENGNSLQLESGSAILIEQTTGKVLYAHNMHEKLRPASVTKIMSLLLIMEAVDSGKISYTDTVPCSENASKMGGSQIWLDVKETLTVDEMLKAMCVVSANDCTVAMAEYIAGSQEAFVSMMNEKAKQLGMIDTTFKNCHGIDEDGHETSSYDIALMSRELLTKHPDITKYTTIYMDTLRDGKSQLVNTNKLIRNYKGATGLKTGSTGLALYNLSATATRDGLSLIAVIMKAPSTKVRFEEAEKLLDYGFSHYSYQAFAKKGEIVKKVNITKGVEQVLEVVYEQDAGAFMEKGNMGNIEQVVTLQENIEAPVQKGDIIGKIEYKVEGQTVGEVNLLAATSVKKIGLSNVMEKLFFSWFRVLR